MSKSTNFRYGTVQEWPYRFWTFITMYFWKIITSKLDNFPVDFRCMLNMTPHGYYRKEMLYKPSSGKLSKA